MDTIIYYDFEKFRLDVVNEQLLKENNPIQLTHKTFKTLLILVQNSGQLVKKEDIINSIWRDSFVEDANLTQHIYLLRKTLGNNNAGKPFIETIPKRGYLFTSEVIKVRKNIKEFVNSKAVLSDFQDDSVLNEELLFLKSDIHHINDSLLHQTDPQQQIKAQNKFKSSYIWFIFGVVILLGIGLFLSRTFSIQSNKATSVNSMAVLPFKPIGAESSNEKLGFGMADAVIMRLSKLQKIPIRPTSAIFRYTDQNFNPIAAGKELEVDSILEGTIQREGEWVRVSVRLIKVDDGTTLFAETFDEKFTHIFALQDSISSNVAKTLSFNLSNNQEAQITTRTTNNTDAYQAYQLGIYFWNKRTKEDLEKAVIYFQKAVQIDENYALSYAMLADSYNMLYYYQFAENSQETIDKADEAAKKALALNDSLAESQIAMSFVQIAKYKNFELATQMLERAIQLSPYNATARIRYGWQLLRMENLDETLEQMRIAQSNDPLSPVSNSALCSILIFKRNYPEALKFSEKAVELQPNAPSIKIQQSSVYFLNGKIEESVKILKEEIKVPHSRSDALAGLAYIYAKTEKITEAEEIFKQLKSEISVSKKYSDLALVAFSLGKKDESLEYFKKFLNGNRRISFSMMVDPFWEDIWKDENYRKFLIDKNL